MKPFASAAPSFDYIPGLDGLRACAVAIVIVAHLGFHAAIPGGFGVTLFFFISGMLITRLLLAERAHNGGISILRFYARRMFRLYPALLVAVALAALVFSADGGIMTWGKVASALFYYANYYGIYVNFGQGRDGFDPFSILWSLAVEEQYYVIFPFICLALAAKPKRFGWVLAISVIVVLLWRVFLHANGATSDRIYMGTDTRIDSILYGAWLTLILATDVRQRWVSFASRYWVLAASLLLLLSTFLIRDPGYRDTLRYSLQGLALMPLVTAICFTNAAAPLTAVLEKKGFRRIGAWSYSLYLYHPIAIVMAESYWGPGSLGPHELSARAYVGFAVTALVLTFILAPASYRFIEKPFMQWRRRFGAHIVST